MYSLLEDLACIALMCFISSALFVLCAGGLAVEGESKHWRL